MEPSENHIASTLPASWYREEGVYNLERRSIFSKQWLLLSHEHRFREAGEYARFEVAGYPFFIMKDRKGNINSFLNVCRHRAFPLVHEDSGKSRIIACKYHGWSYGLNGDLAKAPRFDTVSDFEKKNYSLYKVHTHIDKLGFLWVNLDSSETPVAWETQAPGIDTQERLKEYDMSNYSYDHTWDMDGDFNWKALMENYNECYHCPVAHPGFAPFLKPNGDFPRKFQKSYIEYYPEGSMREDVDVLPASPTYVFPNATVTISKPFFYMMSAIPTSPTTTRMHYEIYRNNTVSEEEFKEAVEFFKQVEREDKLLGNGAQGNLNTNTYVAGPLHPRMEESLLFFHRLLRQAMKEHFEVEKVTGKEIWPARRVPHVNGQLKEDEAFAEALCGGSSSSTCSGTDSDLSW
ncbi:Rieske [2Fe-2S] iron-sulfur domain-containing protein [Aspergillus germanicus]